MGRHPKTWVIGGDIGVAEGRRTWRFELAWLSDVPATASDLRLVTVESIDWVAGVELFLGETDTRINLQLAGHHLLDTPEILGQKDAYNFNGAIENVFSHNRWRARLRFSAGIDEKDVYLNPEVSYQGFEPHEMYLGYHYFDGKEDTFSGFHKNHDLVTLGWRAAF
jgi:hypothetical protein